MQYLLVNPSYSPDVCEQDSRRQEASHADIQHAALTGHHIDAIQFSPAGQQIPLSLGVLRPPADGSE
jgi:hypothetical protein